MWEGSIALPFVLDTNVIILEHDDNEIRGRALSLFAGRARRAVGLRGEVDIRITSNTEMQALNRRFRKKNKSTDVLSFPSDIPGVAGDIAISAEIAAANAGELGHSTETEVKILVLHGMLHLAGFDHESDEGEMRARESSLRLKLGLPVGLIERTHAAPAKARKPPASRPPKGRRR